MCPTSFFLASRFIPGAVGHISDQIPQTNKSGDYNRNGVRCVLGEEELEHGQQAVDRLIRGFDLDAISGSATGTDLSRFGC